MDKEVVVEKHTYKYPNLMKLLEKFRWREFLPLIGLVILTAIFIVLTQGRLIAN